jgi:RND family efflux transporter MFP subunit
MNSPRSLVVIDDVSATSARPISVRFTVPGTTRIRGGDLDWRASTGGLSAQDLEDDPFHHFKKCRSVLRGVAKGSRRQTGKDREDQLGTQLRLVDSGALEHRMKPNAHSLVIGLQDRGNFRIALRFCENFEIQHSPERIFVGRGYGGDDLDQFGAHVFRGQVLESSNALLLTGHLQRDDRLDQFVLATEIVIKMPDADAAISGNPGYSGAVKSFLRKVLFCAFKNFADACFALGSHFRQRQFNHTAFLSPSLRISILTLCIAALDRALILFSFQIASRQSSRQGSNMLIAKKSLPALLLVSTLLIAACGGESAGSQAYQAPVPSVETMTVRLADVPNVIELSGRARAYAEAEIRPQVTGIISERLFKEGDVVKKGQALYQIDAAEYAAAVRSAEAALAKARATADVARETAGRYERLAGINAISQQEYDQAVASASQADAEIGIQKAALDRARIDLSRTKITSPIDGRIGRSTITQGALVTQNQTDPLARVLQTDPIYVDLTVSSARILGWRQQIAEGKIATTEQNTVPVDILLADGTPYALQGDLEFSEVNVEESAGTVAVRVVVPNPDGIILPGMFVRAELVAGYYENVATLPQSVVSRTPTGDASVMVVNKDGIVEQRQITVEQGSDDTWTVLSGLSQGESIATSSLQSIRDGMKVQPSSVNEQTSAAKDSRGGSK